MEDSGIRLKLIKQMGRIRTIPGDVFLVKTDEYNKQYFQFVAKDSSQLNSDVIRVFKRTYTIDYSPTLSEIVDDEVMFYAHCIVYWGHKHEFWEKVGNIKETGDIDAICFRDSNDYGNPQIKISHNWWVWNISGAPKRVGPLVGGNQKAEIGVVFPPDKIINRIKNGKYGIVYPEYE